MGELRVGGQTGHGVAVRIDRKLDDLHLGGGVVGLERPFDLQEDAGRERADVGAEGEERDQHHGLSPKAPRPTFSPCWLVIGSLSSAAGTG